MSQLTTVDDSDRSLPATPKAWSEFIASELKATHEAYLAKPAFLLGHSRTERQTSADYAGRELLELVQNAADAAAETGGSGRVLIEVTRDGLFVANSGQPFRTGGVSSLMTAHKERHNSATGPVARGMPVEHCPIWPTGLAESRR